MGNSDFRVGVSYYFLYDSVAQMLRKFLPKRKMMTNNLMCVLSAPNILILVLSDQAHPRGCVAVAN